MEQLLLLLLIIPFVGSLVTFMSGANAKIIGLIFSLLGLAVAGVMLANFQPNAALQFELNYP